MGSGSLVFSVRIPLAWGEMDAFGHVNNVAYFRWLETARMHYLHAIGITHPDQQGGIGLLLAETRCTFLKPLHFPDTVSVRAGVERVGNTSFIMNYEVHSEFQGLAATAESVQVMFDYRTNTKSPVPDTVRAAIAQLQAGTRTT
ncbi:MAG: acyl-CoA thioesterase [Flavobacteriales bacterium]|nr:acyl-CoA thioesterase [Flavobacteriales bacterium]MBK9196797.1 acyl-CoA thioesterase [Flavobacteriales bacterium]